MWLGEYRPLSPEVDYLGFDLNSDYIKRARSQYPDNKVRLRARQRFQPERHGALRHCLSLRDSAPS
jgi:hypothetical protein